MSKALVGNRDRVTQTQKMCPRGAIRPHVYRLSTILYRKSGVWFSEALRASSKIERFGAFEELSRALIKRVNKGLHQ